MPDQYQPAEDQSTTDADRNGPAAPRDDVMNIITGVQAELDRLRLAQEQQTSDRTALEDLQQELDEQEQTLTDRDAQVDQRQASLTAEKHELTQQRDELDIARQDVQNADADVAQRTHEVQSREAELNQQKEALCTQQDKLNEELASLGARRDELDATAATLNEESATLDQRQTRLQERELELEKTTAALQSESADLQAEFAQSKSTIKTLLRESADSARQLQSLQAELEQTRTQLETAAQESASPAAELRQDRLRRIRRELRRRAGMITQAKDALLAKSKKADRILEQRQAVAEAQNKLDSQTKKLESRMERSRGMSVLFLGVIAILGLGAASWMIVSRVVPATYIASATLGADDTSGALSSEQLDAWRDYCTQLASAPFLMEIATDRMSRRGILEFANAATLSSKMSADLDLASPTPGQLTLSLTGLGADRTERILNTFVATLVSAANDAQQRRLDDASTVVVAQSTVDVHPIDDPRLLDTAIVWGASVVVVLLLALGLWAKLSLALRKFDQENQDMLAVGGRPF